MNPFEGREYSQNNHKVRREFLNERDGRIYQEYISGKTQVQIAREFRMPRRNVGRVIHMAFKRLRTATALILLPLFLMAQDSRETKYHHNFNYAFPMTMRHAEKPVRVNPNPLAVPDTLRLRINHLQVRYDTTKVLILYNLDPNVWGSLGRANPTNEVRFKKAYLIQWWAGLTDPHTKMVKHGEDRFVDPWFNELKGYIIWNYQRYNWK